MARERAVKDPLKTTLNYSLISWSDSFTPKNVGLVMHKNSTIAAVLTALGLEHFTN